MWCKNKSQIIGLCEYNKCYRKKLILDDICQIIAEYRQENQAAEIGYD